jgi:hypothetical protein
MAEQKAEASSDTTDAELGALYKDYNPQSAMGGLFAPAYIHGLRRSEDAVAAWNAANRPITYANIEQTRMPNPVEPGPVPMSAGNGVYGGPIPLRQAYGDPKGMMDPEALRVLAQGGRYDFNARRDAIAARLAANAQAAGLPPPPPPPDPLGLKQQQQPSLVPYQDYNNVGA